MLIEDTQTEIRDPAPSRASPAADGLRRFREVRGETERRAALLSPEDQQVQSMPDASPTKWHRAHTSWFFEQFMLRERRPDEQPFDPRFAFLFNSYYVAAGPRHSRFARGLVTRPTADEVGRYRAHVDTAMTEMLSGLSATEWEGVAPVLEIGLNHEQQHQELILTDILHAFAQNPMLPAYDPDFVAPAPSAATGEVALERGIRRFGHDRARFRLRQRGAVPRGARARRAHRAPPRHQRRVAGLHGGSRLRAAGAVAVGRLVRGPARGMGRTGLLAQGRRSLDDDDARRPARGRSGGARVPCEPLRGRRLRAVVGQGPAERVRVGGGRPLGRARRRVRNRLAMDPFAVRRLSGVPAGRRRARRVQRQVHVEPDGAPRLLARDPRRPQPPHLPQLLLPAAALAVHGLRLADDFAA